LPQLRLILVQYSFNTLVTRANCRNPRPMIE